MAADLLVVRLQCTICYDMEAWLLKAPSANGGVYDMSRSNCRVCYSTTEGVYASLSHGNTMAASYLPRFIAQLIAL